MSTYGSWLYGDARGFRTRHHREHVEGDYKTPPPPGEAAKERCSRESLKQPPVELARSLRSVTGLALKERFEGLGAVVVCVAVFRQHIHLLVKTPVGRARAWTGIAKRHAWFVLRGYGWVGKLWGKRSKDISISDRAHQLKVYRYILAHASQGAWIWKWNDPS
jgi:hypothetical protein